MTYHTGDGVRIGLSQSEMMKQCPLENITSPLAVTFEHGVDVVDVDEQSTRTVAAFPCVMSEFNDHAHVKIVTMHPMKT